MAESVKPLEEMTAPLVRWYLAHERAFPWRTEPSPYRVWVSEIMLQQTRIEAALPYFERFMTALPTVNDLAQALEEVLMKLWEGLGYYSRVRNLQKAAQCIVRDYGGELPGTYEELVRLPGIGDYTAGAIASIAFGQRAAAVDGNVLRVMARMTDDDRDVMQTRPRRELTELVRRLVPAEQPGAFNQGLMELGETVCLPNTLPRCHDCPVREYCAVAGTERARELPTRAVPRPRRVERRTVLTVIAEEQPPRVLVHKRAARGLLAGLWELPNVLTEEFDTSAWLTDHGLTVTDEQPLADSVHLFSHVEWRMSGRLFRVREAAVMPSDYCWTTNEQLAAMALPAAFRTYTADLSALLEEDVE